MKSFTRPQLIAAALVFLGLIVLAGILFTDEPKPSSTNLPRSIAAGSEHTIVLREDGTVVAAGNNENGRCDVSGWRNIVAIAAGEQHTAGLQADGTVVTIGNNRYGQLDVYELKTR